MNILVIPDYFGILSVGGFSNVLLFDCFVVLCLTAHFNCMTTDPGAVPSNARPLPGLLERTDTIPLCKHTGCFKPPRSHYDRVTQRCVVKMDHYCPWVNNTVGIQNHKFFILFCFYIHAVCVYGIILIALRYNDCLTSKKAFVCSSSGVTGEIMILGVAMIAMLFGLFTFLMLCAQMYSVFTNRTYIDRLKKTRINSTSLTSNLWEVFGDGGVNNRSDSSSRTVSAKCKRRFLTFLDWMNPFSTPQWGEDSSRVFGYWVPNSTVANEIELGDGNKNRSENSSGSKIHEEARLLG